MPTATAPGVEILTTKLHAPDVNKGFVPRDRSSCGSRPA